MKAAVVQARHEPSTEANLATARRLLDEAARQGADLALLPEYWFFPHPPDAAKAREAAAREDELVAFLRAASAATGMAVAANALRAEDGLLFNVLHVCDAGRLAWSQPKLHPMPSEQAWGIAGGAALGVHPLRGASAGGLVCADILYPEAARLLALQGAEVVLNPVLSRLHVPDRTKEARQAVFVARAWDGACFVLKASGFVPGQIAGRSLVAAPWGLLAKARAEDAEEVLVVDLDLDALRAFRKEHRGLQDRRPDAYGGLVG